MTKELKDKTDNELYLMLKSDKSSARKAFDELYLRFSNNIYTFCRKFLQNDAVAEDIFQEVFLRLHTCSQKGMDIQNVGGFLITIARNLCYNEISRKGSSNIALQDNDLSRADNTIENSELKSIVNQAIASLPEQFREVIIMKEHLDMSYAEIAKALDQTVSAIRIRIYRAKEKLREYLTPYLNDLQD